MVYSFKPITIRYLCYTSSPKMSYELLNRYCVRDNYPAIRCKTTTSIVHRRLEQFFARHIRYDYSDERYTYIVTRIKRADSEDDYMEITYTQYSSIYDSPTKEITINKPSKMIRITDNYSEKEKQRYQYRVHQ
jgi:hypothetical protein